MAWSANEALEDILGSGSDGDSYAGDESNAMNECDTDLESEPGDLEEDDEQPTEESPPEQSDKQPKRRRTDTSPVASSSNVVRYHGCGQVASRGQKSPRAGLSLSAGHTPVLRKSVPTQPRALNVGAKRGFDDKETLSAALGNITNMLGSVIERLDKTESKLESMERKLNSPSSSSSGSGADAKRKVPTIVRTETRKVYKTLLDGDEFTGFDLSPETNYNDSVNQSVSKVLIKEVCAHNPNFSASDVRAAAYTYYTSLCQDEAQKRKGIYAQRKTQRRRRERVVRRRAERESQFNKMSFSDADRIKWKKVFVTELMSSDESGEEDGNAVFIVKKLQWRSERVSSFFARLDNARSSRKTEQASRQTKPRVQKDLVSSRPAPRGFPSWAVVSLN